MEIGELVNPAELNIGGADGKVDRRREQHVTAGLELREPKVSKKAVMIAPFWTENWLKRGDPIYSPNPNPAVLEVTVTPVTGCMVVLSFRPVIMPVTVSVGIVKLKSNVMGFAVAAKLTQSEVARDSITVATLFFITAHSPASGMVSSGVLGRTASWLPPR
jgi:hypothetical protein